LGRFFESLFGGLRGILGEVVEILSLAVILAIIVRIFLCAPYTIPSWSMSPVLQSGDRILVNKFVYRLRDPARGDIVVFKFPLDERIAFIKRIIALPEETIEGTENGIYINGQMLKEEYLPQGVKYDHFGPVQLGAGEYFMMGDHRQDSQDSRFWGAVSREKILGQSILIYWPLNRVSWLSGK
jgi:signal peptidase I